jgi:hypothetical protein
MKVEGSEGRDRGESAAQSLLSMSTSSPARYPSASCFPPHIGPLSSLAIVDRIICRRGSRDVIK